MPEQVLHQALAKLDASAEREYLDEAADAAAAETYYAGLDVDVEPPALFAALSELLETTHRQRPTYRPAVELYPWVDLQPDGSLRSMYTQEEYDPRELIEEAAAIEARRRSVRATAQSEAEVEAEEPYNCEHVVPQSWFEHDEPMRGDLHHLFTCERKCNSFRGNTPYAQHPPSVQLIRERCGRTEAAGFEPWAAKGPAARATLYFLIRYPALLADKRYPAERIAMLVEWHAADPVGEYERHRNAAIFERQGNRNPLIDHPDWAGRIGFR